MKQPVSVVFASEEARFLDRLTHGETRNDRWLACFTSWAAGFHPLVIWWGAEGWGSDGSSMESIEIHGHSIVIPLLFENKRPWNFHEDDWFIQNWCQVWIQTSSWLTFWSRLSHPSRWKPPSSPSGRLAPAPLIPHCHIRCGRTGSLLVTLSWWHGVAFGSLRNANPSGKRALLTLRDHLGQATLLKWWLRFS